MHRSYLFVPGDRPERFAKACASGADAVIVDLEDAVAPAHKAEAREALAQWLTPAQPVHLRINAASTDEFALDLPLVGRAGVAGVLCPKAEIPADIARVRAALADGAAIVPIIETARGFANLDALAQAPGVARIAFGSIDFQVDLGIDGDGEELLYFRSRIVLASRLANLAPPVDGVTTAIEDAARLRADTERARRLGFGAKLCIHPRQVEAVNACFTPGADEVAWAERVLAARAAADHPGAFTVDGRMVDAPVLAQAERILARRAPPGRS